MVSGEVPDTYKVGMIVVVTGIFVMFFVLTVLEIIFDVQQAPSIGYRLEMWSRKNPWFAAALLTVLGALVAHFVLNAWPPDPPS
jgi:succinate dehydrogenase hydrophobic anchor subunit